MASKRSRGCTIACRWKVRRRRANADASVGRSVGDAARRPVHEKSLWAPARGHVKTSVHPRCRIIIEYARWTARAAVNVGPCPVKAREPVYRLLEGVAFAKVIDPERVGVGAQEFNAWHEHETNALCCRAQGYLRPGCSEFPAGWGAKLINVYLKTAVYVGNLGSRELRDVLHPPLDAGLRNGLRRELRRLDKNHPVLEQVWFQSISAINPYTEYRRIIDGCEAAARELRCRSLFELEQFWAPR